MKKIKFKSAGFTLIELMIVVVIIAIIASIAFPAYTQYVIRAKRSEGRAALVDSAARLERYYSDNNQYADLPTANIDTTTETGKYNLVAVPANNNQNFTLTATPTFTDVECGNLTLDHTGARGISGGGDINICWGK